ncbi:MAG: hypothetical protein NTY51_15185 [Deltaproteobacteria bacterium]|nr:hypothetical protein [Deltaproteobacteria bacterium]
MGWFLVRIKDSERSPEISEEIDALFNNSLAETLTETEKGFQLGFVSMTEAILSVVQVISFVVIGIILIVLANTMAMTARERSSEYAVLKTLEFGPLFIFLGGDSKFSGRYVLSGGTQVLSPGFGHYTSDPLFDNYCVLCVRYCSCDSTGNKGLSYFDKRRLETYRVISLEIGMISIGRYPLPGCSNKYESRQGKKES